VAEYLLPKPPRRGYEFFPGWGATEVGIAALGLGAGAAWWLLATLCGLPLVVRAVPASLLVAMAGGLAMPQPGGGSPLWRTVRAWRAWSRRPRRRPYAWHARDD